MATNTVSTINAQVQQYMPGYHQTSEMIINNVMMSMISASIHDIIKNGITRRTLPIFLLVISITELKDMLISLLKDSRKMIIDNKDVIFRNHFKSIYTLLNFRKKITHNDVQIPLELLESKNDDINIFMTLTAPMLQLLIAHMEKCNANINYENKCILEYLNMHEWKETRYIKSICWQMEEVGKIFINNNIDIVYKCNKEGKILDAFDAKQNELLSPQEFNNIDLFSYIRPVQLQNLVIKCYDDIVNNMCIKQKTNKLYNYMYNFIESNVQSFSSSTGIIENNSSVDYIIASLLNLKIRDNHSECSVFFSKMSFLLFIEIYLFSSDNFKIYSLKKINDIQNDGILQFNKLGIYIINLHKGAVLDMEHLECKRFCADKYDVTKYGKLYNMPTFKPILQFIIENKQISENTTNNKKINISITPYDLNIRNLENIFINKISEITRIDNKKQSQKIYILRFVKKETHVKKKNPEYEQYMKRLNLIKNQEESKQETPNIKSNNINQVIQSNQNQQQNVSYDKLFLMQTEMPLEEITTTNITYEIEKKEIRTFTKPLDTLYLREQSMIKLKKNLDIFKNGQHHMKELGIPIKLGILGYGVAGTGKTSTILAIATYLNRDIYYLDLNGIETNNQAKMLFDYAIKENVNGSVICLEDIDAMTDVVLKRSEDNEFIVDSMVNLDKSKFTLSYLLNLLDGTLCAENTAFVITTNYLNKLDPAIYRSGRIDVKIEFKKCDKYQIKCIYKKILCRNIDDTVLNRIKEDCYLPAEIIQQAISCYYDKDLLSDEDILAPFLDS